MIQGILRSAFVGFVVAAVAGALVGLLGASEMGKLLAALYFLPGLVLAAPLAPYVDAIYEGLFPGKGAPGSMTEAIPLAVVLWTLIFAVVYYLWTAGRRMKRD